jgi:dolichol-phosphate mannosyltransferase
MKGSLPASVIARAGAGHAGPAAEAAVDRIVRYDRPEHLPAAEPAGGLAHWPPELTIVVPTLNERGNIEPLLERLHAALGDTRWEAVFVDDESSDGTYELLRTLERQRPNLRTLRRVGRRGLSSACIEGMLATAAPFVAVMDADLQHDESLLPQMLAALKGADLDIAVGTRFAAGGSTGDFGRGRLRISQLGSRLSRLVSRAQLSDPMSGFFMLRRSFFEQIVPHLSGQGFKILLDLFASSSRPVRFVELPYHFRQRHHGSSKLDTLVMLEYIKLLADKLLGKYVPVRFIIFVLVGLFGVFVHLAFLGLGFRGIGMPFYAAQVLATLAAMTVNFNLNNIFTYRDRRLRGFDLFYGHLSFYLACTIGALANFAIAQMLFELRVPWALAGLSGAVVGSVWNYGVSATFTWRVTK